MYNSKLITTYSFYDHSLRKHHADIKYDIDDVVGFDEIAEIIYQAELLRVFNIDTIDKNLDDNNEEIKQEITILYNLLLSEPRMVECMKTTASFMLSDDLELGLMILYSYDYFFLTHKCVCDFLETEKISEHNMDALFNEVHKDTTKK